MVPQCLGLNILYSISSRFPDMHDYKNMFHKQSILIIIFITTYSNDANRRANTIDIKIYVCMYIYIIYICICVWVVNIMLSTKIFIYVVDDERKTIGDKDFFPYIIEKYKNGVAEKIWSGLKSNSSPFVFSAPSKKW